MKNTLYRSILSPEQDDVLRLLKEARKRGFYMVGGTAIALHIGHRKSIDFDLFLATSFRKDTVQNVCHRARYHWDILHIAEDGNCT